MVGKYVEHHKGPKESISELECSLGVQSCQSQAPPRHGRRDALEARSQNRAHFDRSAPSRNCTKGLTESLQLGWPHCKATTRGACRNCATMSLHTMVALETASIIERLSSSGCARSPPEETPHYTLGGAADHALWRGSRPGRCRQHWMAAARTRQACLARGHRSTPAADAALAPSATLASGEADLATSEARH